MKQGLRGPSCCLLFYLHPPSLFIFLTDSRHLFMETSTLQGCWLPRDRVSTDLHYSTIKRLMSSFKVRDNWCLTPTPFSLSFFHLFSSLVKTSHSFSQLWFNILGWLVLLYGQGSRPVPLGPPEGKEERVWSCLHTDWDFLSGGLGLLLSVQYWCISWIGCWCQ